MTITSVRITRTELSLSDLELTTSPYGLPEESNQFDLGGVTWDRQWATSPYLHGAQLIGATKDVVEGCTLVVDVTGATQSAIRTAEEALTDAFSQFSYTLTVVNDGVQRSWKCTPADFMVGYLSPHNLYSLFEPVRLVFARSPIAVAVTVPPAPTIGAAVAGNTTASVAWTSNGDGGGPLVSTTITPYIAGVAQTPQVLGTTSPQTVVGLTNGTAYTFKVALTNGAGTGAQSAASNAVTPVTVPGAPTIGTATAWDASATVTWTAPASTGGSAITGYVITPYIGATAQATTTVGVVLTALVTGLTNGQAYTFKVAAINAVGTGTQSAATGSVTPVVFTPAVIANLVLWTEGDAITGLVDGDPVATWSDASGGSRHLTQATAGKRPTYQTNELNTKPVVRFDGTDDTLGAAFAALSLPLTVFAVFKAIDVIGGFDVAVSSDNAYLGRNTTGKAQTRSQSGGATPATTPTLTSGAWGITQSLWTATSTAVRLNGGADVLLADVAATTYGTFTAGSLNDVFDYLNGDIAAIVVYNADLSTTDLDRVGNYLATKYGLTWAAAT